MTKPLDNDRKIIQEAQKQHWLKTGNWEGPKTSWYFYHVGKNGKNNRRKSDWKLHGLQDDLDLVLEEYLAAEKCLICDVKFNQDVFKTRKVMNHCHETGYYLNILCWQCNIKEHCPKHFIKKSN